VGLAALAMDPPQADGVARDLSETSMAKKIKIPKTFAGVKLPKALRRGLRDLAASETGRAAVLEALTTATATVAEPKAPRVKAKATKRHKPAADAAPATVVAEALVSAASTEAPPLGTTPPSTSTH
jgi:hypothetical protein